MTDKQLMMELLIRKNKKKRICKSSTPNVSSFFNHDLNNPSDCCVSPTDGQSLTTKPTFTRWFSPGLTFTNLCRSYWPTLLKTVKNIFLLIFFFPLAASPCTDFVTVRNVRPLSSRSRSPGQEQHVCFPPFFSLLLQRPPGGGINIRPTNVRLGSAQRNPSPRIHRPQIIL